MVCCGSSMCWVKWRQITSEQRSLQLFNRKIDSLSACVCPYIKCKSNKIVHCFTSLLRASLSPSLLCVPFILSFLHYSFIFLVDCVSSFSASSTPYTDCWSRMRICGIHLSMKKTVPIFIAWPNILSSKWLLWAPNDKRYFAVVVVVVVTYMRISSIESATNWPTNQPTDRLNGRLNQRTDLTERRRRHRRQPTPTE